jgi:hypothetical protein
MKKLNILFSIIFLLLFNNCEPTEQIPIIPQTFEIGLVYPNPASIKDTLTIGMAIYELELDISNISMEDISILLNNLDVNDTLLVTGIIKFQSTESGKIKKNQYIQAIIDRYPLVIQCSLEHLKEISFAKMNVIIGHFKTKESKYLLLFY